MWRIRCKKDLIYCLNVRFIKCSISKKKKKDHLFYTDEAYSCSDHVVQYWEVVAREWEIDPLDDDKNDDDILSNYLEFAN